MAAKPKKIVVIVKKSIMLIHNTPYKKKGKAVRRKEAE